MPLSLKTKTIIVWLCTLLALALALTLVAVAALSGMKDRMVADSVRLAEEQVTRLRDDVVDIIRRSGAVSPNEIGALPQFEYRVETFRKDTGEVDSIVFVDNQGKVTFEKMGQSDLATTVTVRKVALPQSTLLKRPIIIGDQKIGDLEVMLSHSKVLHEIQTISAIMTFLMGGLVGAMILILAGVFFLLWRMFRRHLDMVQRQDQIERMAYVGTLASGLAHEIRNPLNAMNLNLQIMEEDIEHPNPDATGRVKSIAHTVRNQVSQLNATLGNFLSFALPRGRELREFDLCGLVREIHDLLRPEIERRGVQWIEELPASATLHGEPAAFHEVVVNLALNALHAMETIEGERRLMVTITEHHGSARLEFADTGPGVPPRDLERIFEVFYSTREGGSGFGLAIARRIVQDHGGTIKAGNRNDGGARFTITVPAQVRP